MVKRRFQQVLNSAFNLKRLLVHLQWQNELKCGYLFVSQQWITRAKTISERIRFCEAHICLEIIRDLRVIGDLGICSFAPFPLKDEK